MSGMRKFLCRGSVGKSEHDSIPCENDRHTSHPMIIGRKTRARTGMISLTVKYARNVNFHNVLSTSQGLVEEFT